MKRNSEKLMLVGYNKFSDNYRLLNPITKKIKESRHVKFDEEYLSENKGSKNGLLNAIADSVADESPEESETEEGEKEQIIEPNNLVRARL